MDEKLSFAHAGDHYKLEKLAQPPQFWPSTFFNPYSSAAEKELAAAAVKQDTVNYERDVNKWLDKYRLKLRTHLYIYHSVTEGDLLEYGHTEVAEEIDQDTLVRLHQELHAGLIDQ